MRCLHPQVVTIKDRTRITGGYGLYPCGKCLNCLADRRKDWSFRMEWEQRRSISGIFLTLTYDNETVPRTPSGLLTLKKDHLKTFLKSLKQAHDRWFEDTLKCTPPDHRIKYYAVGEYGTKTMRPHYHAILFNLHPDFYNYIQPLWAKGHIHIGTIAGASINYVAKYLQDSDWRGYKTDIQRPFSLMSKGIGSNYLESNKDFHKTESDTPDDWRFVVISEKGHRQRLPRYYREKIFAPEEAQYYGRLKSDQADDKLAIKLQSYIDRGLSFEEALKTMRREELDLEKRTKTKSQSKKEKL